MNVEPKLINFIKETLKGFPSVERAALFGSRAREDNHERSDYDIAIYGTLSPSDTARLRYLLQEELPTLHKIDVVFMQGKYDEAFLENIRKEGIPFYEKI